MTLVTAVIPVHNRRAFASDAVASVLSQSYPHVEVLVVDDGSTDGSADSLEQEFGNRIRIVRLPTNQGRSTARNTGWALARGELVAFLDSDDLWDREKLTRQVPHFADPAVVLVHSWVAKIDAEGRPLEADSAALAREFALAAERGWDYAGLTETWCRLYTSAAVVRREALRTSAGFDPRIGNFEDWDVLWRIAKTGRVIAVEESLVRHRTHAGNTVEGWANAALPWLHVCRKHLSELPARNNDRRMRRARHNLLLNLSLGEYWRRNRWASRWWMWRALLVDPRPLRRPGYYMWAAPLLHAFLPRPLADYLVRSWEVDPYADPPEVV